MSEAEHEKLQAEQELQRWCAQQAPLPSEQIELSVIIPAYNERWRLPSSLLEILEYLTNQPYRHEVIIVDDGSRDDTAAMVQRLERLTPSLRLIRLPQNMGKGHAVRVGMLNAKGQLRLMADADGSTPIQEIERLKALLNDKSEVVIGSRALASSATKVETRFYRKYLGRCFNFVVNTLLLPGVADTQCGFKLFSAKAATFLFEKQRCNGFAFDIEVLYLARRAGIGIQETPVNWHHSPGSKVNLVLDSLRMFLDVLKIRVRHAAITSSEYARVVGNLP
jgi:dolichyl-phosphate beta-glucosyltransferase